MDRKTMIGARGNESIFYQSSQPWRLSPRSRGRGMPMPLPMIGHKLAPPYPRGQGFDTEYFEMDGFSAASSSDGTPFSWSQIPRPLPPMGPHHKPLRNRFDSPESGAAMVCYSTRKIEFMNVFISQIIQLG